MNTYKIQLLNPFCKSFEQREMVKLKQNNKSNKIIVGPYVRPLPAYLFGKKFFMDYLMVLYIDPGTGGMLFTILFGIFGVAVFSIRALMLKLKYRVSGGNGMSLNRSSTSSRRENRRSRILRVPKMILFSTKNTNTSPVNSSVKATKLFQN